MHFVSLHTTGIVLSYVKNKTVIGKTHAFTLFLGAGFAQTLAAYWRTLKPR